MCGIIGLAFNFPKEDEKTKPSIDALKEIFSDMLVKTQKMGASATGVILLNKDNKITYAKTNKPAKDFVETNQYKELLNNFSEDTKFVIGHCRAAITGEANNNKNNHPHIYGKTIGVHNGSITKYKETAKEWGIKLFTECDSELIFALYNILREHLSWSRWKSLNFINHQLKGTLAFAMLSQHDGGSLILYKNFNRLDLAKIKCRINDKQVWIFSSELYTIYSRYSNPDYIDIFDKDTYDSYLGRFGNNSAAIIEDPNKSPTILDFS